MYYQNYEDYMRSVLGYPIENNNNLSRENLNTYETNFQYEPVGIPAMSNRYHEDIIELYPEIYKVLNPMVCKICEANTKPITRELIDQMTDEIYLNIEEQPEIDVVNIRVNANSQTDTRNTSSLSNSNEKRSERNSLTNKESSSSEEISNRSLERTAKNRVENSKMENKINNRNNRSEKSELATGSKTIENVENRESRENRQRRPNNTLRDLIRILILNRLLGGNRPQNRPPHQRPPIPGPGPNPMPPRPPRPPHQRPPYQREDRYYNGYFDF